MSQYIKISTFLLIMTVFVRLNAGVTGKISGHIRDKEDGTALIGANVIIEGTVLGAATDINGFYNIINIPAGTYQIKVGMIGYKSSTITNVEVKIDQTTSIDVRMYSEALEMGEVVVVAERPVLVKDVSHSELYVDAKNIETMPVAQVTEVVGLQAGVEGLEIRGGASTQTAFIVDGFVRNDERSNRPYTTLSLNSVEQVQVQTGGFNAEYGNIRSGIINVITKEGRPDRYSGAITYRYSPPAQKHFGASIYDANSYYLRPYLDPAVCYVGTKNGVWDSYTQKQYPTFEGWNAISERYLLDSDPSNDLTPDGAMKLFEWQHRRMGAIEKSDYTVDFALGGPVPFIAQEFGNLRFYISYFDSRDMFVIPASNDSYDENIGTVKMTSDITDRMKLSVTGSYGETHSVCPYNWTTTPTGYSWNSDYELANAVSSGPEILFVEGYYSPSSVFRNSLELKLSHSLSSKTYYDILIQRKVSHNKTYQIDDRDTSSVYSPIPYNPGYLVDEAPYGYMGYSVDAIGDGMIIGGWMNLGRDRTVNSTYTIKSDFVSQINNSNKLKGGVEVIINNYNVRSFTANPGMTTWNRDQVYDVSPYRLATYFQDKLEFEGLIADVGFRLELINPNAVIYQLDDYSQYYKVGTGSTIEETAPSEKVKPYFNFCPRVGVSHPITDNSKLFFNYGHFYSEPQSTYRFRMQREYNGQVTSIGNPNLRQEKTIAYEIGYSHNLFNQMLLNITGYYKDVSDQIGWVSYRDVTSAVNYLTSKNSQYEDIRGFEITLDKKRGSWLSGFVNYTYMVSSNGYFGLMEYYQDPVAQKEYINDNPYQVRAHPRPYFRANIDLHSPETFGPSMNNIYPIGGWYLNILGTWKTGSFATFNPNNIPGLVDNVQWKNTYNINLKVSKQLNFKKVRAQLFAEISNVLNTKFLSYTGFSNYNNDYLPYLTSLRFDWEDGIERGSDRIGDYRPLDVEYDPLEINPNNDSEIAARNKERIKTKSYIDNPNITSLMFLNPRNITFGIKLTF